MENHTKSSFNNYIKRNASPCLNCLERHTACHDECDYFKKYKKNIQEENDYKKKMRNYSQSIGFGKPSHVKQKKYSNNAYEFI